MFIRTYYVCMFICYAYYTYICTYICNTMRTYVRTARAYVFTYKGMCICEECTVRITEKVTFLSVTYNGISVKSKAISVSG